MTHQEPLSLMPTVAFDGPRFWGKPDLLPNGDRRSCFHSHMGLWLMEPTALKQRAALAISRLDPETGLDNELKVEFASMGFDTADAMAGEKFTAVVPIFGAITKKKSKFSETSALETRRVIRQLAADPSVEKIVLHIDSPGGAVSGVDDLASEVRAAAQTKPVVAYIEDLGASAAYWIASQATEIVANRSAFVGSLGTYGMIYDTSGAYERQGVKVHLISSGGVKGKGGEGLPVDDEVLADQQRIVDKITDMFKSNVASGRKLSAKSVDKLFDGRVHAAEDAMAMGLIDRIGTLDSVIAEAPMERKEKEEEEDEESEPEDDKEKDMPKSELDLEELKSDVKSFAATVKANGCPLSLESIEKKLLAAGEKAEDNLSAIEFVTEAAEKMSKIRGTAGSMASPEPKRVAAGVPSDYKSMQVEYKRLLTAKIEKLRAEGRSFPEAKAVAAIRDEHPALVEALNAEATRRWNERYANGFAGNR